MTLKKEENGLSANVRHVGTTFSTHLVREREKISHKPSLQEEEDDGTLGTHSGGTRCIPFSVFLLYASLRPRAEDET